MDSITQGVLGAAIGEAMLGKIIGNKAALTGAIIATIPDLDVLLYAVYSPYEMLNIHRGFSHSILFSLLSSFIIAMILSKIKWYDNIKYRDLYLFSWLCVFTHIILDTFTAYGTQLFLPFSNERLGFDSINVVDPLYTLPLLFGLILSLWIYRSKANRPKFNKWGLIISSIYLLATLINKEIVNSSIKKSFAAHHIEFDKLSTMPVGIANIDWYGLAKGKDSLYLQKYSSFSNDTYQINAFPINEDYLDEIDQNVADKMRWFAKGFYTVDKFKDTIRIYNLQVDMRGVIDDGGKKAPTVGYFEVIPRGAGFEFSSGSIK